MPQRAFLSRVLPTLPAPDLFGCAPVYFSLNLKGQQPNTIRNQNPCSSYDTVISRGNNGSACGFDAYMALASFKNPLAGRKQINAHELRCVWADIDVGKPKSKYRTQEEALAALVNFSNITGFKPTILVSSGMGFHAYWTFNKNIPVHLWVQVAGLFHQLCIQEGLDVDPSRATDSASVLRLPGTYHQKTGQLVRVLLDRKESYSPAAFVSQMHSKLRASVVTLPDSISTLPRPGDALSTLMGMGPQPPSANAEKIARNCPQILRMGSGAYPEWFAAMSVLRRCVNGLEWAHGLSAHDKYGRYDPAVTEKKFYDAAEDAPARCQVFEMANPALCMTCPHRGNIKSPVQLTHLSEAPVQPVVQQTQSVAIEPGTPGAALIGERAHLALPSTWTLPYMPIQSQSWKVDQRGVIWIESKLDANKQWTTNEHVITSTQIWFKYSAHRCENGQHYTLHYFDAIYPNGSVREIRINARDDMTEQNIMKCMNSADIHPKGIGYGGKLFMGFINAYLDSVLSVKKVVPIVKEFGWTKVNDPVSKQSVPGFIVGQGVITDTGIHPVGHDPARTGMFAEKAFAHKGTLKEWKHVPRMYTTLGQKFGEFGFACAFAAPFMRYGIAEAKNSYVNLFSTAGGKGKTTLMRALHSVWGDPEHAFGSPGASASQRGRVLSVWNNLPFFVDEITKMKNEDMNNMVYILAGGMDKDRLKSNADFMETGHWSTYTMSTANRSVKEALSRFAGDTDATLLRVTEYECDFPDYDGMPEVQRYIRACIDVMEKNHGVAGPEFMFQVMCHPERLVTLRHMVDNWRIRHGFKDNERFLAFSVGMPLHVVRWAVEWGILDFDVDALERWVLDVLVPFNRSNTAELAPDFVNNMKVYLNARVPNMLVVRRKTRASNETDSGAANLMDKYIIHRPTGYGELVARHEKEDENLYFSSADFKKWCHDYSISPLVMVKQLAAHGILLQTTKKNLGSYVSWLSMSTIRCYVLDKKALKILGFEPPAVQQMPVQQPNQPVMNLDNLNGGN